MRIHRKKVAHAQISHRAKRAAIKTSVAEMAMGPLGLLVTLLAAGGGGVDDSPSKGAASWVGGTGGRKGD